MKALFTITRENRSGLMEWMTPEGWRSSNTLIEKSYYTKEDGWKEVARLRKDCRIKSIAKSIIVNYS